MSPMIKKTRGYRVKRAKRKSSDDLSYLKFSWFSEDEKNNLNLDSSFMQHMSPIKNKERQSNISEVVDFVNMIDSGQKRVSSMF